MKDSFLLLSDEGKEGVLLFHQELGESLTGVEVDGYTLIEAENLEEDTLPHFWKKI